MDILKGFIDIVSNPIKAVGDAVDGAVRNLADDEARRQAEEEERRRREEEERKRREEEKRRAEEEERARRAEEVRRQQEQAEKQRQELQRQANELNNNRQNMSDEEYSMKRQELTLKDNGFNDLQSKLNAEKYSNAKVSDNLKIDGEGEEGRHQFNVGKIAHKLFDGSDADNLSVEQMGKRWSELGGNDQQDIMANLKTLQYRYTQEGKEQEALSTARLLGDLERYGGKAKDRDFLNSLVTNAKHGGFAGDIASNIEQTLGNVTGQGEKFREILNARQNDMDSLDGWNKAGNTIGNIVFDTGANLVSGGAKMALDTGMGAINVGEKALDEKTLDENGKIRNHNLEEQAGLIGSELVTDGLRLAGAKGLTPSLDKVADLMRSGSGIKQILPEVAKYGVKELGTVLPTSYMQTNLNVMGNGGHFGEAKLEDIAKDTAMNIGTDLAMDIRSGLGRARTGGQIPVGSEINDGKLNINRLDPKQWGYNLDATIGNFTGDTNKRMSKRSFNSLQDMRENNPIIASDGQEINLTGKGNRKYTTTSVPETSDEFITKQRLVPHLEDAIRNSTLTNTKVDYKNHGIAPDGFDYREIPVRYKGEDYNATLNVAKSNNQNTLYGGNIRKDATPLAGERILPADSSIYSNNNIPQNSNDVNFIKQAYHDGILPIPKTKFTPNAGIKSRLETAFEKGLTGDYDNNIEHIGRLSKQDVLQANNIQNQLGRDGLNANRDFYLRGDNIAEHAQKRFAENPDLNTPKYLSDITYNALYGNDREVLANNKDNANNVIFANKNNPSGVVPIGKHNISGENEIFSVMPINERKINGLEKGSQEAIKNRSLDESRAINNIPQNSNDVKNLKIEDGEINDFIKDQVKKQNNQNKVPLKEKLADNVANLKHYLIDDAVAYERYTKDKALKKELREGIDRVRSSETIASQFIRDTGLSEALGKMSKQEQNEFSQYLIAKRHLEVADRDIVTGRDLNIDKAIVDKFSEKYKVAEEVYRNHNKAILEHMAEHGLISSELKDKLIAENPNYAPLQRIMDEAENFSGNSKQLGNLSNQSVVKGLKGSERVVDNPLEATLNNTFRMINEVERNKVARSLAENVFGGDNVEVTRDMPNWAKQPNMDIDSHSPRGETVNKIVDYEGRKAVELEDYITDRIPENVNNRNFIRKEILDKFRGKNLTIQDGEDANITRNGAGKLAGASYKGQSEEHVDTKINSSMYIDELGLTVRNLHEVENTKDSGRNANRYIKGDTTIISRGKQYEAELVIKKAPNGDNQIYDVVIKKDTPSSLPSGDITMSATSLGVPRLSGETKFSTSSLPDRKGIVKGLRLGETEKLAYLDNGKKVEIEVPKLVAKEMKNLNGVLPDGLDKVISVLAMPAKTLRAGATGLNPIFVASNLVRDQIQSAVSGGVRSSIGGFNKAFKATFLRGEEADALRAELARSGLGGSEYRMTYGGNKGELLKQLQAEHKWTNGTMEKLRHPINTLADIIGITENFTRAQQYFGTKGDITTKAQASRNNTLNFSRGGSVVKVLNKIIPFLNAGVQGGRQTVNLVKERPVHTGVATALIGGVILAADAINKSDERRKELWDRVSDSDKKTNIIAFTPDAHYNPETNRIEGLIKIPMPQIFYPLLDLQNAKGTIPEKGLKIASDIFAAVSGIDVDNPISQLTPTAVKPILEQFTNKNFFTGRELVSDYDKNKRPDEKGAKYSSGIAREIANLTGIDAPVVDNYITGFTGSLGGDMAKTLTDNPDNTKDGKGIMDYIGNGVYRRFLSTNITSQNQIAEDKAKKAKEALNNDPTFKNMSREDQIKVLNAIDNDFSKIASTLSKKEQNREDEVKKDLNDRQKALMDGNFEAGKYAEAMQAGKEGADGDNKYNKKDNKKAFYKQADAEYEDFKKEFAEKSEKGEYSRLQKIEAEHKLKRLELTKEYDKDVRESYGASKTNLYKLYNILNSEEKENLKGKLNGINDIMLKNGEISQKEYDSKYKIINEIESIKGVKGGRGQKGGAGYVKGLKVEVGKLPEFKMENAPKIKSGESKLNKTTGIVKGLTLNSKTNKEEKVGLKRVRVTIR